MGDDLLIRPMRRDELDVLVGWAADEGWNPGLHDAGLFWETDPAGFLAAETGGEMVGGGSTVSYAGRFGFMGFFIVARAHRGRGLGRRLWEHRRRALLARLEPGASIGMDGVFAMQPFYERGGFVAAGRDLRFEGVGEAAPVPAGLLDARRVPFDELCAYDSGRFPAPRPDFLRRWIAQPGSLALAAVTGGEVRGYGVARPCRRGVKVGPLFAADRDAAERLLTGLGTLAPGEPLVLDVPEGNAAAMGMVGDRGMAEVFGCARMYLGPRPALPEGEVFGVTTFELG